MRRVLVGSISAAAAVAIVILIVASVGSSAAPVGRVAVAVGARAGAAGARGDVVGTPAAPVGHPPASGLTAQMRRLLPRLLAFGRPLAKPHPVLQRAVRPRGAPGLPAQDSGTSCPVAATGAGPCSRIPCDEFIGSSQGSAPVTAAATTPVAGVLGAAAARPAVPQSLQPQSVTARSCTRRPPVTARVLPVSAP